MAKNNSEGFSGTNEPESNFSDLDLLDASKHGTNENVEKLNKKEQKALDSADAVSIIGFSASGKSVYLSMLHHSSHTSDQFDSNGWRANWAKLDSGETQKHLQEMSRMIRGLDQNGRFLFKDQLRTKINRIFPKGTTHSTDLKFILHKKWGAGDSERCLRVHTMDLPGEAIRKAANSELDESDVFFEDWKRLGPLLQQSKALLFFMNCMTFNDEEILGDVGYLIQHLTSNEGVHPDAVAWVITGVDTLRDAGMVDDLVSKMKKSYRASFKHLDAEGISWDIFPVSSLGPNVARKMKDPPNPACQEDTHICHLCQELTDAKMVAGERVDVNPEGIMAPWNFIFEKTRPWYERTRSRAMISEILYKSVINPITATLVVLVALYALFGIPAVNSWKAESFLVSRLVETSGTQELLGQPSPEAFIAAFDDLEAAYARFSDPWKLDFYAYYKRKEINDIWQQEQVNRLLALDAYAARINDPGIIPSSEIYDLSGEFGLRLPEWLDTNDDVFEELFESELFRLSESTRLTELREISSDILNSFNGSRSKTVDPEVVSKAKKTFYETFEPKYAQLLASAIGLTEEIESDPFGSRDSMILADLQDDSLAFRDLLESDNEAAELGLDADWISSALKPNLAKRLIRRTEVLGDLEEIGARIEGSSRSDQKVIAAEIDDYRVQNRADISDILQDHLRAKARQLRQGSADIPEAIASMAESFLNILDRLLEFDALLGQGIGESKKIEVRSRIEETNQTMKSKFDSELNGMNTRRNDLLNSSYLSNAQSVARDWTEQLNEIGNLSDDLIKIINANVGFSAEAINLRKAIDSYSTILEFRLQLFNSQEDAGQSITWNEDSRDNPQAFRPALIELGNALGLCRQLTTSPDYRNTQLAKDAHQISKELTEVLDRIQAMQRYANITRVDALQSPSPSMVRSLADDYRSFITDSRNTVLIDIAGKEFLDLLKLLPEEDADNEQILNDLEYMVGTRPPEDLVQAMEEWIIRDFPMRDNISDALSERSVALERRLGMVEAVPVVLGIEFLDLSKQFQRFEEGRVRLSFEQQYRGNPLDLGKSDSRVERQVAQKALLSMELDLSTPLVVRASIQKEGREVGSGQVNLPLGESIANGGTEKMVEFSQLPDFIVLISIKPQD